jgi:hypothetical protein
MIMKRKLIFLSSEEYLKDVVDTINEYFDKGYEIEEILDANCGYYFLLVWKGNGNNDYVRKFDLPKNKYNLIEENDDKWFRTVTKNTNITYN